MGQQGIDIIKKKIKILKENQNPYIYNKTSGNDPFFIYPGNPMHTYIINQ